MENASKALLIAGGILIALLILSALVILFVNLSEYQSSGNLQEKTLQVSKFNNQYEAFNKNDVTLMELKSLYNKIQSNNVKYPEYPISSNIKEIYSDIEKNFSEIEEEHKQNKVFKCIEVKYENEEGRISEMKFEDVTPPRPTI